MKRSTLSLHCTPPLAMALAQALRCYADAAYPPGGSECAQVAHEALLDTARLIADTAAGPGGAAIPRRQRHVIRGAVQWYCGIDGPGRESEKADLLALLEP